jgi:hypothetical protein
MTKFRIPGVRARNRTFFCLVFMLWVSAVIHTQEKAGQISLGLSPEINMDTRRGLAIGGGLYADYAINEAWAAGIKAAASYNLDEIISVEPEAFIRWYIPLKWKIHPFLQADLGAVFIWENTRMVPAVLGGLSAGMRFPLKHFFVEPYAGAGFPFLWRAGIALGFRFNI